MSKLSFSLDRVAEKNGAAIYKISGSSIANPFFLGIDRPQKTLSIYLSDNFMTPVRVIDTTKNFSIAGKDGIDVHILAPILARSMDIMKMDHYPSGISFAA